jgi:hypothetical protein
MCNVMVKIHRTRELGHLPTLHCSYDVNLRIFCIPIHSFEMKLVQLNII